MINPDYDATNPDLLALKRRIAASPRPSREQTRRQFGLSTAPPPKRTPKFIKLAPGDVGEGLPDVFFEDPLKFVPKVNSKGQIRGWGLYDYDGFGRTAHNDAWEAMARTMRYQIEYTIRWNQYIPPEKQFLGALMDRKRQQLAKFDLGDLPAKDVVLNITMPFYENPTVPEITRRVRLSAGMKLSQFQDKVLNPVMGWERNLHGYYFTDYRDGALYAPVRSSAVDFTATSAPVSGYEWLPDDEYTIAHLFEKQGDLFGYVYDLGDRFQHEIEVVEILPKDDSTGEVVLLEGRGACPGENMSGNDKYGELIAEFLTAPDSRRLAIKNQILSAPNYASGPSPAQFHPLSFDILHAQRRLGLALSSKNSLRDGAKGFIMPMREGAKVPEKAWKGQGFEVETKLEQHGYWEETKSTRVDAKGERMCAVCGKTGDANLQKCGACKKVSYCGAEHQKLDWTLHKIECRKVPAAMKKAFPPSTPPKPSVAHLDLGGTIETYQLPLISAVKAASTLKTYTTKSSMLTLLASSTLPTSILVTSSCITEPEYLTLRLKLVHFARQGGRVIFGGSFSSMLPMDEIDAFLKNTWELAWKVGGYHCTTHSLRPKHPLVALAGIPHFPGGYSMKSVWLRDVPDHYAVYRPTASSRVESHVFAPSEVGETETPIAMGRIGEGWVGWIGDVNAEQGTSEVESLGCWGWLVVERWGSGAGSSIANTIEANSGNLQPYELTHLNTGSRKAPTTAPPLELEGSSEGSERRQSAIAERGKCGGRARLAWSTGRKGQAASAPNNKIPAPLSHPSSHPPPSCSAGAQASLKKPSPNPPTVACELGAETKAKRLAMGGPPGKRARDTSP